MAKLFLGMRAASKGMVVVIGSHSSHCFKNVSSGFLLHKDHAPWSYEKILNLKRSGVCVGVLDEEGLIYRSEEIYKTTRVSEKVFQEVDVVYLWGSEQKRLVEEYVDKGKIKIVGNPRFDLLKYIKNQKQAQPNEPYNILINTRFPSCNNIRGSGELDNLIKIGVISSEEQKQTYLNYVEKDEIIFKEFLRLIKLFGDEKKFFVTIRPHPAESIEIYKKIAEGYSNVIVDNETELVKQLILNNCVIHDGCTTAIEAYAAGKPVIGLRPQNLSFEYGDFCNRFSNNFSNADDVLSYLKSSDFKSFALMPKQEVKKYIKNWLSERDCVDKIVSSIQEMNINEEYYDIKKFKQEAGFKSKLISYVVSGKINHYLMSFFFNKKLKKIMAKHAVANSKFPIISKQLVSDNIEFLKNLTDIEEAYQIDMIDDKSFVLRIK
ncbi:hypothetical protein HOP58_14590 [Halomonas sp. MCCC 1A11062]|nr:hypothetical protein [Halomonas sp. MCCC 1A11062]